MNNAVAGFSKLSKEEKLIDCQRILFTQQKPIKLLKNYWNLMKKFKTTR
jgi:hypothetical protein